jgi:hypothetical protein
MLQSLNPGNWRPAASAQQEFYLLQKAIGDNAKIAEVATWAKSDRSDTPSIVRQLAWLASRKDNDPKVMRFLGSELRRQMGEGASKSLGDRIVEYWGHERSEARGQLLEGLSASSSMQPPAPGAQPGSLSKDPHPRQDAEDSPPSPAGGHSAGSPAQKQQEMHPDARSAPSQVELDNKHSSTGDSLSYEPVVSGQDQAVADDAAQGESGPRANSAAVRIPQDNHGALPKHVRPNSVEGAEPHFDSKSERASVCAASSSHGYARRFDTEESRAPQDRHTSVYWHPPPAAGGRKVKNVKRSTQDDRGVQPSHIVAGDAAERRIQPRPKTKVTFAPDQQTHPADSPVKAGHLEQPERQNLARKLADHLWLNGQFQQQRLGNIDLEKHDAEVLGYRLAANAADGMPTIANHFWTMTNGKKYASEWLGHFYSGWVDARATGLARNLNRLDTIEIGNSILDNYKRRYSRRAVDGLPLATSCMKAVLEKSYSRGINEVRTRAEAMFRKQLAETLIPLLYDGKSR